MNQLNEWVERSQEDWDSRGIASRVNWLKTSDLSTEEASFRFSELSPSIREALIEDVIEYRKDLESRDWDCVQSILDEDDDAR